MNQSTLFLLNRRSMFSTGAEGRGGLLASGNQKTIFIPTPQSPLYTRSFQWIVAPPYGHLLQGIQATTSTDTALKARAGWRGVDPVTVGKTVGWRSVMHEEHKSIDEYYITSSNTKSWNKSLSNANQLHRLAMAWTWKAAIDKKRHTKFERMYYFLKQMRWAKRLMKEFW